MAIKSLHIFLALFSFCSFAGRIMLSEYWPEKSHGKWLKIVPPIIDTSLLASGIVLAVEGGWLTPLAPWLLAKLMVLLGYIGLGVLAMRQQGRKRWPAFAASVCCFGYIVAAAVSKQVSLFV